jgi:protein-disulfide isomerase
MGVPLALARTSILRLTLAGCGLAAGCASPPARSATDAATTQATQPGAPVDGRALGPADAPVTVIEFTDLQCPFCGRFARQTWPELRARYIDTGKVRFVSRDFPLPSHPYAMPAAIAARCAEQQGHYWEFREAVFRQQARLGSEPYAQIAASLGLDTAALEACRRDPEVRQAVESDFALGESNGIEATPSFAIGHRVDGKFQGEIVSGALSIEAFSQRIDALLQQSQH